MSWYKHGVPTCSYVFMSAHRPVSGWGLWGSNSTQCAGTHTSLWLCVSVGCETMYHVVRRMVYLIRVAVCLGTTGCEWGDGDCVVSGHGCGLCCVQSTNLSMSLQMDLRFLPCDVSCVGSDHGLCCVFCTQVLFAAVMWRGSGSRWVLRPLPLPLPLLTDRPGPLPPHLTPFQKLYPPQNILSVLLVIQKGKRRSPS